MFAFTASAQGARRGRRPSMQEAIDISKFDKKLYSGVQSLCSFNKMNICFALNTVQGRYSIVITRLIKLPIESSQITLN